MRRVVLYGIILIMAMGGALAGPRMGTSRAQSDTLLPAPVYFLGQDLQLNRLERDGVTVRLLNTGGSAITSYDVSSTNGQIAYVQDNNLFVADGLGLNARLVVEGGALTFDEEGFPAVDDLITIAIDGVRWSADGQTLYYGRGGLNRIPASGGTPEVLIPNVIPEGGGLPVGATIYRPGPLSPDGTRLLAFYSVVPEGTGYSILDLGAGTALPISGGEVLLPCCDVNWSTSGTVLYISGGGNTLEETGLWVADSVTGSTFPLIEPAVDNSITPPIIAVVKAAIDFGDAVYLFYDERTPTQVPTFELWRATPSGALQAPPLRDDTYDVIDALWASGGEGVLILDRANAILDGPPPFGFPLLWLPTDGSPAVTLSAAAVEGSLRWGVP